MTMRLDIVTNDAGDLVRLEHARDMGSATVQAVYRLLKLVQIHDLSNQAFVRQLEQTHEAIVEYGLRAGANFNVLFASKAVFVGGQLLKGSRAAYDAATELGDILEWCGGSDLTVMKDTGQKDLQLFAEAVGAALRSAKGSGYKPPSTKIRLRAVTDAARFRGLEIEPLTFEQKIVRTYASAVVIMRRFFEDLQASRYVLPRRIKRVAQSLVDLSDGSTPAFLGVTDVRNQNFDDAGRAVNTAILAVSMARELTQDRVLLAQIAMAAMMHDVGRPRAAALGEGGPRMPGARARLSEDAEDKLAAGTAAVLTALGRVNEPTITRTVVAFEALWLRRERFLGPLYGGERLPTVHAKIVQISRRYNDLVTPEPGLPPPSPDFAVATLSSETHDEADRTVLRLLVATLNLLPIGSVVQLTTNEVGELIHPPSPSAADGKTWIRIGRDGRGAPMQPPIELDLTAPRLPQQPDRRIARVLSIEGWSKGLELLAEEEPPPSSGAGVPRELPAEHGPDARITLDAMPAVQAHIMNSLPPEAPEPPELEEELPELEPLEPLASLPELEPVAPSQPAPRSSPRSSPFAPAFASPSPSQARAAREAATAEDAPTSGGPSSSSVPSIASLLAGPAREYEPSSINDASSNLTPISGTSPSMVAQAMGRAMEERGSRPPERQRNVAIFEDPMIEVVAQLEELEPSARGTLTSTPIVHVLVYMLDHGQTGTVVLREVDGRHHVVYFQDGRPSVVRNGRPVALLGDGLVASGLISPEVLVRALEVARQHGSLLGHYLVESGLISAEALRIALSTQVARKLERLVNLAPDTDYAFYGGVNLIPDWANGELFPCHPLTGILSAVRSWHDRARLRATLGRIAKQTLSFHPEVDLGGLVLTTEEQSVVEAIHDASSTLSSIYDLRLAGEDTVSSLVYTFAVTRSFAFTAAKGAPMVSKPAMLEEITDEVEEVQATEEPEAKEPARTSDPPAATVMVASPVALLEASRRNIVPRPSAPSAPAPARTTSMGGPTVPNAWRPAKVPSTEVADPAARAKAEPAPTSPPLSMRGAPPSVAFRESQVRKAPPRATLVEDDDSERLVQAMTDFRMAETALARNDVAQADELAKKAYEAEPTNADYGALVAWIGALSGSNEAIPLAIAKLNVILKEEALCERALLYRGRLYKRAKRTAEALRDFTAVLDINPKNTEAATEARIMRMKKK